MDLGSGLGHQNRDLDKAVEEPEVKNKKISDKAPATTIRREAGPGGSPSSLMKVEARVAEAGRRERWELGLRERMVFFQQDLFLQIRQWM